MPFQFSRLFWLLAIGTILAAPSLAWAQFSRRGSSGSQPGTVGNVKWSDDGQSLTYISMGKRYRFDLQSLQKTELGEAQSSGRVRFHQSRRLESESKTGTYVGRPRRGRQYKQVDSPDGRWEAHYQNHNVILKEKATGEQRSVTVDGNKKIHYGTASWVYGEELEQKKAMWWSVDSRKLLFYRFDDTHVQPFHLLRGWTEVNTTHYPEYYPKAGSTNPGAQLLVYDVATEQTKPIKVGDGSSEQYIYDIRSSPDGAVLLVNLTDRLQQNLRVYRIDLDTGECTQIIEEVQDTWQENKPGMRYLKDNFRFIWTTERSGYSQYELRDLNGKRHHLITSGEIQCSGIEFVDEEKGQLGFTAYGASENPYFMHYFVVGMDGKEQKRVTSLEHHHSNFRLSPDKKWLVAQYEEVNRPPSTALYAISGELMAHLAKTDPEQAANLAEMFHFRSSDDRFDIYGVLYKPKNFNPKRNYALINAVYGGPNSNEISARYVSWQRPECDRGYLVVKVNNRGTGRRGKAFLSSNYLRLGDVDIQDHADAVRQLIARPYIDGTRVGIVGHSYGGFMAAMGVLKHADVYTCAVNRAGVTDWRNYDTIYTERFMSTPELNAEGYDRGRAMNAEYLESFKRHGRQILIMHGMVDDNVHPNNAFQLIDALDRAGIAYESRFFPNGGHGLGRGASTTQWEFFDRILKPNSMGSKRKVRL